MSIDSITLLQEPITEEWLKEVGFKWDQFERQPSKNWTLWLAGCQDCGKDFRFNGPEDFGLELAHNQPPARADDFWFCFFRSDCAGRYHRFIHVRHLRWQSEVIALVVAISGLPWNPANHIYGSLRCQSCADRWRAEEAQRFDIRNRDSRPKWNEIEKDDTRNRVTPEALQAAIDGGKAK
jgi:hypothetical protein